MWVPSSLETAKSTRRRRRFNPVAKPDHRIDIPFAHAQEHRVTLRTRTGRADRRVLRCGGRLKDNDTLLRVVAGDDGDLFGFEPRGLRVFRVGGIVAAVLLEPVHFPSVAQALGGLDGDPRAYLGARDQLRLEWRSIVRLAARNETDDSQGGSAADDSLQVKSPHGFIFSAIQP